MKTGRSKIKGKDSHPTQVAVGIRSRNDTKINRQQGLHIVNWRAAARETGVARENTVPMRRQIGSREGKGFRAIFNAQTASR